MRIDPRQLQHAYKHAVDFGVTGPWNTANAAKLEQAIRDHLAAPAIRRIAGTFRGTIAVTHCYNAVTGLNVTIDAAGDFVAGWKLGAAQTLHLLASGNVQ